MKKRIMQYLCTFSDIENIRFNTSNLPVGKKFLERVIKIPVIIKTLVVESILRQFRYRKFRENGNILTLDKYSGQIVKIYLPLIKKKRGRISGDLIQNLIFLRNDFYEANMLQYVFNKYLRDKEKNSMIDVGANIGNHTMYFKTIGGFETIYAFEPVANTFNILEKNISINQLSGIKLFNCGVGEKHSRAKIGHVEADNCGATQLELEEEGNIEIIALDDIINEKIDFIKIDVEGFEKNVLYGAKELLKRDHPIIWIEIFPQNKLEIESIMRDYGYQETEAFGESNNYIFTYTRQI